MPTEDNDPKPPVAVGNQCPFTDEDKSRIRLEEQFRLEIRRQFEEGSRHPSQLWTFLNSTFGLWLMSAILVTWAGTIYTQSQNKRAEVEKRQEAEKAEAQRNKELVERLDLEIAYRFSQFQIHLDSLVTHPSGVAGTPKGKTLTLRQPYFPFRPGKGEKDVREAIDSLSQPAQRNYPALYQEFSNLSTLALMAELRRHVPSPERGQLDQVIADLSGVYIFLDVRKARTNDVYAVGNAIFDGLLLPRWKEGRFYYSDCPFC